MAIDLKAVAIAIDRFAAKQQLATPATTALFQHLLGDALTKATTAEADGTYFVKTGDIPAMWLRDATFQVLPYVQLIDDIPDLQPILIGVLRRELRYLQHDPYANAFNETASGAHWSDDESDLPISDLVWERKFEVDSLCAPLLLALRLYEQTGITTYLDAEFWQTLGIILTVLETEQQHATRSTYYFKRENCPANDTLTHDGRGAPVAETGMIWNGFRPSDNASELGYHVPSNMFVVAMLRGLLPLVPTEHTSLRTRMQQLMKQIEQGITDYAVVILPTGKKGYAYEVDGLGHAKLMDDANVPSLLSLPFIGYTDVDNPLYQATRQFVLSADNPYYYQGSVLQGVGSNHTPNDYVWPISLAMVGLTTTDKQVKQQQLALIAATDNGTKQCHESVHMDDTSQYTRDWFSWANMTYCQLALELI
ncbi:glycoside hydrolase family 125 protein [Lactiplantibacillus mudanjiangensis]|uniref:Metal-independent alpha-mannosidase [Lactobacillus alimentarius DSM] n=1 Tax=Lactiplantibacillus mudanjiangensis TaxID=1296538 RepID=A0A660DWN5_9LACO|nr:glycoside hydrolase family 125 protein [Lactiplantibacillus mudanjiangensis]VDG19765.1 metal-independent alpha-mannosidase [Lactobacillus alimentarius DSM] [Lactiplantibacillus mudanjiangensis]VDG23632.1 metal-independent alpha-mannosidase [Lactobacillus alimentarius DSM] [Lactiplantibacillus mudanjiangensis]VDG27770.1 metal-independent alpha-mannosidase [Lactobacillus alimentarius DSM] [Lactiplantibacillus mudanjiangensis]VDG31192.1 metal-independent alpha-mannosidase [Lactobacillus aliment